MSTIRHPLPLAPHASYQASLLTLEGRQEANKQAETADDTAAMRATIRRAFPNLVLHPDLPGAVTAHRSGSPRTDRARAAA
jgi:hypothetical protein